MGYNTHSKNPSRQTRSIRGTEGFTMFEIVVMLGIVTAISTVVLFSFTGLNEGVALNRSVREIALAFRKAQNMSLAVTSVETSLGPRIPKAIGVRLSLTDPQRYFVFADLNTDGKWDIVNDAKIGNNYETFLRGIKIVALECRNSSPPPIYTPCPSPPIIHIIFTSPEATLVITDTNGADAGDIVNIRFGKPTGSDTKTVTVRTSGQISIK